MSFSRFSWLTVLLAVAVKAIWMGHIWSSSSSDSSFYYQISRACTLHCSTPEGKPEFHPDVLEYVNPCMAFLHADNSQLLSKTRGILKEITDRADIFQIECDSQGAEKSFRVAEVIKNQERTYLVIVFDTANCSVVRLENFCNFIDKTELFNNPELLKEES